MQAAKPRSSSSEMAHKASASASSNSKASTVKTTKGTLDSSDGKPNKVLERKSSSKDNSLPEKRIVGVLEIQQQVAKLQEEVKKAREEKSRALRELVEAKNSMKRKEKEISEHSNNRLQMLELELGNAKASQGNMLDSLVSQTKQLEQTKILLEEAKLKIMSLQEGAVDSAGRSNFGNHVDEIGLLRNELKLAMEAEAKSKKAMDDLAIALKEVTTENHRVKDRLSSTQSESEKARAEVERLKALLKTADDKFREANVNSERAKLEMEESMASWTPKESGFINCMRAFEEKISKVTEERDILIHSQRVSREDTSRLRDVMKQALNEATVAKEALEIARAENSQLKDLASEKENALQRIKQEYECLIVSEAAALDSVRELKNLLAATSMDSESVVKFPSDNWRIENPRAQNGPRHSMGELGMFKVSIYDQEQKDRRTASGSNLADSMLPSEDGESLTLDDFDHIDMNQFHGVEPEREFPMKQKKKMPMLRRFGDMLRRSSFHK